MNVHGQYVVSLAVLLAIIAPCGYVIIQACLGNQRLLAGWLLLLSLAFVWYLVAVWRAIWADDWHSGRRKLRRQHRRL